MTTAAVLAFGVAPAFAQDDPTSTPPTPVETTTPTTPSPTEPTTPSPSEPTSTPPSEPTSTPPSSSPSSEPAKPSETPPSEQPAEQKFEEPKQADEPKSDLKLTATFDKAEYEPETDLGITITVSNVGTAPAKDIRFATETSSIWLRTGAEQLTSRPTLGPGEQKTIKLTAAARWPRQSDADFYVRTYLDGIADPTPGNNEQRAWTKVLQKRGTASGVLYVDKNGNGQVDSGEGLANTPLYGEGRSYLYNLYTTTDANGRYTFSDATPGKYLLRLGYDTKQIPKPGELVIEEGKNTAQDLAVIAPTMDTLKPVIELDKDRYGKDAPISIKITLRNTGQAPLTGVVALCTQWADWYLEGDGPGWASLNPDGPGVSIAAGETKVITVADFVPEAAYKAGELGVACNFGNNGRNPYGTVGASDFADVVGAFGTVKGKVTIPPGAAGVTVVALDPVTRRPIPYGHTSETDGNGNWRISDLREGKTVIMAVGPWKHADGSDGVVVDVIGGEEVTADFAVVPGPMIEDPTYGRPDLQLTASFDKAAYDINDQIQLKVRVTNIGKGWPGYPGYVYVDSHENGLEFDDTQLAPLRDWQKGGLWPGESREVTLIGTVRPYSSKDSVRFQARFSLGDTNPANDSVDVSAPVTYGIGDAAITVYGDANENGQLDAGEALADRKFHGYGGRPNRSVDGVTDAAGRIVFKGLPAGKYDIYPDMGPDDDWVLESSRYPFVIVSNGVETPLQVRMVRPLKEKVEASIVFDKPSYEAEEDVTIKVTVRNNSDKPLQIKAACGLGDPPSYFFFNNNPLWGDWIYNGSGYLVEPHHAVTKHIRQPMPANAADHGLVGVGCAFGPDPEANGSPTATAIAKVPGATWTTNGSILMNTDTGTKVITGTKLVLLDPATKKPVARVISDAAGKFTFPDLPVGNYTPVVVGPWKVVSYRQGPLFPVVRGNEYPVDVHVEPGPVVADPDDADSGVLLPPNAGAPAPGADGGAKEALAQTGASVLGLLLLGGLLVAFGFGATAATRRKV
ncbi:hypothetical protein [Lentzea sp. NBRC 105346]|uniref:hypothetical protein n=1 Tax=Lentzea sp. NBRC 105346 TaxID=3032205 RepID=UPI002552DE54|nr:hypothetical protein [Lentzea sp. NBRC 105346]